VLVKEEPLILCHRLNDQFHVVRRDAKQMIKCRCAGRQALNSCVHATAVKEWLEDNDFDFKEERDAVDLGEFFSVCSTSLLS